jgi:lipoate synthase
MTKRLDNLRKAIENVTLDQFIRSSDKHVKLPPWLKTSIPVGSNVHTISSDLSAYKLNTVCQEAKCPNKSECWGGGKDKTFTATIMVSLINSFAVDG